MAKHSAVILDTETDDLDGRAVEIAYYPLSLSRGYLSFDRYNKYVERFNPLRPINLGAMAVHNILDEDLADCRPYNKFKLPNDFEYVIGHNVDYDVRVLKRGGLGWHVKPIDTLAMARKLLPDAPRHTLSVLSYYLAPDRNRVREYVKKSHSALTDVDLTASLLNHLVALMPKEHTQDLESLYLFSLECRVPDVITFGKHRGTKIQDLPESYKSWLMKEEGTDAWLKFAIQLLEANIIRRTYEITNHLPVDTYQDYQFLYSREPETVEKVKVYEGIMLSRLQINESE